jgi:AAA domain, putative AbiEii toxin, Type IV TA system
MRIEKLYYRNHVTGWELSTMEFGDVNLLVGVSGVGKTKILEVIRSLQEIALISTRIYSNSFLNGGEWDVTFSTSSDTQYRWCGKFNTFKNVYASNESWSSTFKNIYTSDESSEMPDSRIEQNEPEIEVERLYLNEKIIASRIDGITKFEEIRTPKLPPSESLLKIFRAEEKIIPLIDGLLLIIDSQVQSPERWTSSSVSNRIKGLSLSDIRNENGTLMDRIGLLEINHREIFNQIKADFISVFSQVEDFKIIIEQLRFGWTVSDETRPVFSLELKEIGVDRWITQSNLSMGMLKTLAHIVEIYLLAEGSILLIDEFENSLGVNCIDVVTELLNDRKDIQFIITSHHPYIINKIPMQYWKIITRKGSIVTATDATDYEELSGSRHKLFTQLINLPDYTEGIQVG